MDGSEEKTGKTEELVVWSDAMSVGHDGIDHQHRRLVDTANAVRLLTEEDGEEIVEAVVSEAVDYATDHFDHEEEVLREQGWPGLPAHAALHAVLRLRILAAADMPAPHRLAEAKAIMEALLRHIADSDPGYRKLFS